MSETPKVFVIETDRTADPDGSPTLLDYEEFNSYEGTITKDDIVKQVKATREYFDAYGIELLKETITVTERRASLKYIIKRGEFKRKFNIVLEQQFV